MRCFWVAAAAVVALTLPGGMLAASPGIVQAQASLSPGPYLFGERITADVDVLVDSKLVDPKLLRVRARFFPYVEVATPRRTLTGDGPTVEARFRYLLQCVSLQCITGGAAERKIRFTPAARLEYRDRSGHSRSRTIPWPGFREVSRVGTSQLAPTTASQAQFSIPLDPLLQFPTSVVAPSPTYRVSPLLLGLVLAALAVGLLVAALYVARPLLALVHRRRHAAEPERSPLERALAAVEEAARRQAGGAEHREALALLARELRRAQQPDLVRSARKLAWSEQAPSASASRDLVARIRTAGGAA